MTTPRSNPTRELFGILGSIEDCSGELRWWNKRFSAAGMDAAMVRYSARADTLPERLSEMFHFDRRGYIVGDALEKDIVPLLDGIVSDDGRVDTVYNDGGVLTGYFLHADREKRWALWCP